MDIIIQYWCLYLSFVLWISSEPHHADDHGLIIREKSYNCLHLITMIPKYIDILHNLRIELVQFWQVQRSY